VRPFPPNRAVLCGFDSRALLAAVAGHIHRVQLREHLDLGRERHAVEVGDHHVQVERKAPQQIGDVDVLKVLTRQAHEVAVHAHKGTGAILRLSEQHPVLVHGDPLIVGR